VDPETGEINLKCLDGMVNHFNATILSAMHCNMDLKFIGSGESAKAILYYITDYISKAELKAHVAYAALELAVQELGEYNPLDDEPTVRAKRLLQKCAHAMISHQELSSQQVMSYLLDFEDHFTSHQFNSLFWTTCEASVESKDPSPECYNQKSVDDEFQTELRTANKADEDLTDYKHRARELDNLCLLDFCVQTEKIKLAHWSPQEDSETSNVIDINVVLGYSSKNRPSYGLIAIHDQFNTHTLRIVHPDLWHIPVLIGSVPRRDREETYMRYC
ncbi:hypothetical protein L208DRAFT_1323169, partial [Tricholoma matsutake]